MMTVFEKMMIQAHKAESLLSYKETPGAVQTINGWIDKGHDVKIITGRPWNQECNFPTQNYKRCAGWEAISGLVK